MDTESGNTKSQFVGECEVRYFCAFYHNVFVNCVIQFFICYKNTRDDYLRTEKTEILVSGFFQSLFLDPF